MIARGILIMLYICTGGTLQTSLVLSRVDGDGTVRVSWRLWIGEIRCVRLACISADAAGREAVFIEV